MDISIETISIGSFIGAIIVVSVNIWLHQKNRKYDFAKEQLIHLYNPLNAIIKSKRKYLIFLKMNSEDKNKYYIEYYNFFLEIKDIYLNNEVYSSLELRTEFYTIHHNHDIEYSLSSKIEDISKVELNHQVDKDGNSKLEQKLNKFIEIFDEDLNQIYHGKPVYRFYK
jgi:hypothetical protein